MVTRLSGKRIDDLDSANDLSPVITSVDTRKIPLSSSDIRIFVEGFNFTPQTEFTASNVSISINSVDVFSSSEAAIDISINSIGDFALSAFNEFGDSEFFDFNLQVVDAPWIDLRIGGESLTFGQPGSGSDVEQRNQPPFNRSSQGIAFDRSDELVAFKRDTLQRDGARELEFIFRGRNDRFYCGVGSEEVGNLNSTSTTIKQSSFEICFYHNRTFIEFLFGNKGNASFFQSIPRIAISFNSTDYYKVRLTGDIGADSEFIFYRLPSANPQDWDDRSFEIGRAEVSNSLFDFAGTNLFPMLLPEDQTSNDWLAYRFY